MANTYLNKNGLSYLWSKIKSYITNNMITKNDVYPIGSVYLSVSNINPSTLFGGTWISIEHAFVYPSELFYPSDTTYASLGHVVYAWKRTA